jgi:hypothetical protein
MRITCVGQYCDMAFMQLNILLANICEKERHTDAADETSYSATRSQSIFQQAGLFDPFP